MTTQRMLPLAVLGALLIVTWAAVPIGLATLAGAATITALIGLGAWAVATL